MIDRPPSPSAACIAALRSGDKIEAIRLLRKESGLDLAAAKNWVDRYAAGGINLANSPFDSTSKVTVPSEAVAALNEGDRISAIRHVRAANNLGLKEARECVDRYLSANPTIQWQFEERNAPRRARQRFWFMVAALVVALGAYLLFRSSL